MADIVNSAQTNDYGATRNQEKEPESDRNIAYNP
jgi:hypothetical protein